MYPIPAVETTTNENIKVNGNVFHSDCTGKIILTYPHIQGDILRIQQCKVLSLCTYVHIRGKYFTCVYHPKVSYLFHSFMRSESIHNELLFCI